jgi:hypothetical protein
MPMHFNSCDVKVALALWHGSRTRLLLLRADRSEASALVNLTSDEVRIVIDKVVPAVQVWHFCLLQIKDRQPSRPEPGSRKTRDPDSPKEQARYIPPAAGVSWWNGDHHLPPFFCQMELAYTLPGTFCPPQVASCTAS